MDSLPPCRKSQCRNPAGNARAVPILWSRGHLSYTRPLSLAVPWASVAVERKDRVRVSCSFQPPRGRAHPPVCLRRIPVRLQALERLVAARPPSRRSAREWLRPEEGLSSFPTSEHRQVASIAFPLRAG